MNEARANLQGPVSRLTARIAAIFTGGGGLTQRLAGTAFLIRVVSAALAYLSQIILARWMGTSDYGIYVYVWTWVLLLGSMMDFGTAVSAQNSFPNIAARANWNCCADFSPAAASSRFRSRPRSPFCSQVS